MKLMTAVVAAAAVCFALTYNGNIQFSSPLGMDERVRQLINAHQLTDKGFGPALGPEAVTRAGIVFEKLRFELKLASSDWVIGRSESELCTQLCEGWVQAATQVSPQDSAALLLWHESRRHLFKHNNATVTVGHTDLVGWPHGTV